jgi:hypothetical protein
MREKKHQYYVQTRKKLLQKMKHRLEKSEKVIKRNMSQKENIKASKIKEFEEAEEKIKHKIAEHFKTEEEQRQALEQEIDIRSKYNPLY